MSNRDFVVRAIDTDDKDYYDLQIRHGYGEFIGTGVDITLSMHIDHISELHEMCETILRNHGRCEKCQEK